MKILQLMDEAPVLCSTLPSAPGTRRELLGHGTIADHYLPVHFARPTAVKSEPSLDSLVLVRMQFIQLPCDTSLGGVCRRRFVGRRNFSEFFTKFQRKNQVTVD